MINEYEEIDGMRIGRGTKVLGVNLPLLLLCALHLRK
jgi:hypothetical protein